MTDTEKRSRLRPWSAATYRIEVEGPLPPSWTESFAGMRITTREGADQSLVTRLNGRVRDQSELTGLLNALADLQLPILSVKQIEEANDEKRDGRG